jgi:hypothetical protein
MGDMWAASAGLRKQGGDWLRGGGAGAWGRAAGHAASALGIGDYVANDIVNDGAGQNIPSFGGTAQNAVTITHKEYISDVFAPASFGTFQNTVYSLNPGIERTFPWLSQVAVNYEEYTLKQLIFTFRSTVTDFVATNGQVGTIIMATQYNPSDNPFVSKQDAMEYEASMSGKCSVNMLHGVECDPAQLSGAPGKYLRAGPVRSQDDLKQYDWGNLNIGVSNIPKEFENQSLGELWVSYTVELRKPKFFVTRGLNILRDTFLGNTVAGGAGSSIGNCAVGIAQQNRIGGTWAKTSATNMRYTFPATFSGTVKVLFKYSVAAASPASYQGLIVAGSNLDANGNQTGILPIWDQFDLGNWNFLTSTVALAGVAVSGVTEAHLQIVTPTTSGAVSAAVVDNTLDFSVAAGATVGPLLSYEVDIQVYNAGGFNYASPPYPSLSTGTLQTQSTLLAIGGSNIIVENPVTAQVETWP